MASIRRSSRTKSHLNSKCQLPIRNSVHLWSFLGQHNKDFHKQSWAFLPLCKGCSGRSLQVWCCCCGRAIDFRVLNRGEQPQVCGCTQCLKEFKRTSCKPPLPWVVYSWQYAGTTHRHYSIPWSSTNSRCFQSSAERAWKGFKSLSYTSFREIKTYIIQLHNVRMSNLLQDCDLSVDPL